MAAQTMARKEKTGMAYSYVGMLFFVIAEAFLFGAFFWTYFYLRLYSSAWPPEGVHLGVSLALVNTAILLTSSGTMQWAISAARRGHNSRVTLGLGITLLLGVSFLVIKVWEWVHNPFRPWDHAYGSIFYTLTGFHALHVLGGILILGALMVRFRAHPPPPRGGGGWALLALRGPGLAFRLHLGIRPSVKGPPFSFPCFL